MNCTILTFFIPLPFNQICKKLFVLYKSKHSKIVFFYLYIEHWIFIFVINICKMYLFYTSFCYCLKGIFYVVNNKTEKCIANKVKEWKNLTLLVEWKTFKHSCIWHYLWILIYCCELFSFILIKMFYCEFFAQSNMALSNFFENVNNYATKGIFL